MSDLSFILVSITQPVSDVSGFFFAWQRSYAILEPVFRGYSRFFVVRNGKKMAPN